MTLTRNDRVPESAHELLDSQEPDFERLAQRLVEEFEERLRACQNPDPHELILAHPEIADVLERRLEAVQSIRELARLHETGPSARSAASTSLTRTRSVSEAAALANSQISLANASGSCGMLPATIGRYEIRKFLGKGATATVYEAYDPHLKRPVALKVTSRLDPRFLRDAQNVARLWHSNIVPLHETGSHDGLHFIDMELVSGETLEDRLRKSDEASADYHWTAQLIQKVAAALEYAHSRGIVHRDIKPSNILLDELGEPHITDFGLARALDGAESITLQNQILGTPAYMPPEQAEGRSHEADARSDVYSLGVVLYRMLTGRLPFETGRSLLYQIMHTDPPAPRSINVLVPPDLETICLKALATHIPHPEFEVLTFPSLCRFPKRLFLRFGALLQAGLPIG